MCTTTAVVVILAVEAKGYRMIAELKKHRVRAAGPQGSDATKDEPQTRGAARVALT